MTTPDLTISEELVGIKERLEELERRNSYLDGTVFAQQNLIQMLCYLVAVGPYSDAGLMAIRKIEEMAYSIDEPETRRAFMERVGPLVTEWNEKWAKRSLDALGT